MDLTADDPARLDPSVVQLELRTLEGDLLASMELPTQDGFAALLAGVHLSEITGEIYEHGTPRADRCGIGNARWVDP